MKTAFLYSDKFGSYYYSKGHPMKPARLRLTFELIEACGLLKLPGARLVEARKATETELKLFHTPEYIRVLKEANTGIIPVEGTAHGLGFGDNPVFNGVFDWSSWCTGASIQAAELVASGEVDVAFNIAGGLHHAMPSRASGFCYINDPVIAIKKLLGLGKRVAYIDIDAHHGDGVEYAFYDNPRVLTISLHESGQWLFPGTGFVTDIGLKEGRGYSINLPLPPGTGDREFLLGFKEIVPLFVKAFSPDVMVTQLGVDTFHSDPITHLNLTTIGFEEMIKGFKSLGIPWVALGGGGYDLSNVARGWTIAWAVMNGVEPPPKVPQEILSRNGDIFAGDSMRDEPVKEPPVHESDMKKLEKDIGFLKKEVLPCIKKGGAATGDH